MVNKLVLAAGAGLAVWYFCFRPRAQVFTDARVVDPARFMPWPRSGIDPGAILPASRRGLDPGR